MDHTQAAVILTNVWNTQNVIEKQQWQEQLNKDAADADARRQEAEEETRLRQTRNNRKKKLRRTQPNLCLYPTREYLLDHQSLLQPSPLVEWKEVTIYHSGTTLMLDLTMPSNHSALLTKISYHGSNEKMDPSH